MKKFAIAIVILVGLSALAFQQANFPGGSGAASLPTGLSFAVPELDVSAAASGNGILGLAGNTSGIATFTAPAVAGTRTNAVAVSNALAGPINGAAGTVTYGFATAGYGMWYNSAGAVVNLAANSSNLLSVYANAPIGFGTGSGRCIGFSSNADPNAAVMDSCISRNGASGSFAFGAGTVGDTTGTLKFKAQASDSNCSSSAAPAVCGSAMAGSFVVAAAATTVTVNTTAVTANSQILLQEDSSLGTKLSVTCNTTPATAPPTITARTAATSFAVLTTSPTTNPRCFSYYIIN